MPAGGHGSCRSNHDVAEASADISVSRGLGHMSDGDVSRVKVTGNLTF